ncbi:MAG: secondary thiamine-phosphate synthase enzyme YjbQ [Candidatus Caldatribacteriota bacterium]|nr:secondary thiamine-phosphate synthase enzyme YjbQ [Candidatus Caldatribacteriota bacterium]
MLKRIPIKTNTRTQILDITVHIQKVVDESKVTEGLCYIFVPHTTAGLTINENADPSVKSDIIMELNKIVPFKDNYSHMEGNSAAHIKASLIGFSQNIIITKGRLLLGTWQGICFCEFDGPRTRSLYVKIV